MLQNPDNILTEHTEHQDDESIQHCQHHDNTGSALNLDVIEEFTQYNNNANEKTHRRNSKSR